MNSQEQEQRNLGDIISKFLSTKLGKPGPPSSPKSVAFDTPYFPKAEKPKKTLFKYRSRVIRSQNAIIHLEYPPDAIPERPSAVEGEEWTRFVCISDTHTREIDVPDGDVLLHSGDLTNIGTVKDFEKTMSWLCSLPHKVKIIIAGNHDLTLHQDWYEVHGMGFHQRVGRQDINDIIPLLKGKKCKRANLVYLQDEVYKFKLQEGRKEWSVYGSPWSPEYCNWAFGYEREDATELVSKIPQTDILLTHGPPYALLDRTNTGDLAGCKALRKRLPRLKPRLHLFGHIHEAHGAYLHDWEVESILPRVQNHEERGVEDSTSLTKELEALDPLAGLGVEQESDVEEEEEEEDDLSETDSGDHGGDDNGKETCAAPPSDRPTVFVNAAAWPMGRLASRDGLRMSIFGGPGFQAVIADLRD